MLHAREDYNRIQDPDGKIADDEPVFLLRAKDKFAPHVVREWARLVRLSGDTALAGHVYGWAREMETWQAENGCKTPDSPFHGKKS